MLTRFVLALAALVVTTLPVVALDAHRIVVKNECSTRLRVAVHHLDLDDNWVTNGWYSVEPGVERAIMPTTNPVFYFTAEAIGRVWNGDDKHVTVRDDPVPYGFRRVEIPEIPKGGFADHRVNLGCEETFDIDPLYYIQVINRCSSPVELYLQYETVSGLTQTEGGFKIAANQRGYLTRTPVEPYYLFARTEGIEWTGDNLIAVDADTSYNFMRADARKIKTLTCQ